MTDRRESYAKSSRVKWSKAKHAIVMDYGYAKLAEKKRTPDRRPRLSFIQLNQSAEIDFTLSVIK